MDRYDWRDDPELVVWLCDSAPAPKVVSNPIFDSQYRFIIQRNDIGVVIRDFVPSWGVDIVRKMLDADLRVRNYVCRQTFKGATEYKGTLEVETLNNKGRLK